MTVPIRLPSRVESPDQIGRLTRFALDAPNEEQAKTITASYTVQDADDIVLANGSGSQTITLPAPAVWLNRSVTVVRTGTGACTVVVADGSNISGAASRGLATQWDSFTLVSVLLAGTPTWIIR